MPLRPIRVASAVPLLVAVTSAWGLRGSPDDAGWRVLFDGATLEGWTTRGGPYDGAAEWTVEDGCIVGRQGPGGAGGLLYTEEVFRNVELELEARVPRPFDSGVFLRMTPDARGAQVTLDHHAAGEIGGVYADGWWLHQPDGAARFDDGWHRFAVRCVGDPMHVTVRMDGELLTDYRFPADAPGFAAEGRIGLQVHGGRDDGPDAAVAFRGLRVRELPAEAGTYFATDARGIDALTDAGRSAGWRALFDGESLAGWEAAPPGTGYRVEDGVVAFLALGGSPELRTARDFDDFHLRLDFRIARGANSGLFLRAARDGSNPAFSGCEVQILDDFHWEEDTGTELRPWQVTGSLYGAVPPPAEDVLRPLGEWNTFEVVYRGPRLAVALNGRVLYDLDTHALDADPPFASRAETGFLGLQRHAPSRERTAEGGEAHAWFRNAFVREL